MKFMTPIYFIKDVIHNTDAAGDTYDEIIKRKVLASLGSITQSEFYQAHQSGLRPELKLEVRSIEYYNELTLEYNGENYNVLRTYDRQNGIVELTCSKVVQNATT